MEAERVLVAADAQWKKIQQNTFTRWTNEQLRSVSMSIDNLETDFGDGIRLIILVEVLSQKRIPKYNKNPTFRSQKLENVSVALEFLQEEGIKLVNIDSSDIVDCKLKLILGLVWTLILHYSISMSIWDDDNQNQQSGQTPKQRLLNWIQTKIPDMPIKNFTNDWTTGKPVGALVDACAPGLCPDWESWDPENAVQNATEAMGLADEWLDVRQLITPEELVNPNVDEQSVMTYLSQYPNCQLKEGAPLRAKRDNNYQSFDGVHVYGPGIEPLGIVVGSTATFAVDTQREGDGPVDVEIVLPNGQREKTYAYIAPNSFLHLITYRPKMVGLHKVVVKYSGFELTKSPYYVNVELPGNESSIGEYKALDINEDCVEIDQLEEGTSFTITGKISAENTNGFHVNFEYKNEQQDVALHFNPRLHQNTVIRNTKVNGVWGTEELESTIPFAFATGQEFQLQVVVTKESYLMSVNGSHLDHYPHRLDYNLVQLIRFDGDIENLQIYRQVVKCYPKRYLEYQPYYQEFNELPLVNNRVPIEAPVDGRTYIFSGKYNAEKSKVFSINFCTNNDADDIHLHIVYRPNQGTIVINNKVDNIWIKEDEYAAPVGTVDNKGNFTIQVLATDAAFLVAINGRHLAEFTHRKPMSEIKSLLLFDVENGQVISNKILWNQDYPCRLPLWRQQL